jgi:peptidoglycan/LPS O-acetylase OafA/YrhL
MRGVAALVVVLAHFFQFFLPAVFVPTLAGHLGEKALATTPFNLLVNGNFAVTLFFVLSGFVLSAPFFLKRDPGWYLGAMLKRYPRLALPAAASTVFAVLIGLTVGFHYDQAVKLSGEGMPNFWADVNDFRVALWQGLAGSFFFGEDNYNKVLWSIRAELLGSLLIFAAVPTLGRLKLRWIAYGVGIALSYKSYLLAFVLGALIADVLAMQKKRLDGKVCAVLFLAGIYLASFPYHSIPGTAWAPLAFFDRWVPIFILTHIVGAALLVYATTQSPRAQTWMESRPALWLGRVSFSMYLVHFTLLASIGCRLLVAWAPGLGYNTAVALLFPMMLATVFVSSWAFCLLVDEPTLRFGQLLVRRLQIRRFPAATVIE